LGRRRGVWGALGWPTPPWTGISSFTTSSLPRRSFDVPRNHSRMPVVGETEHRFRASKTSMSAVLGRASEPRPSRQTAEGGER
jgi:hypothetical protein